MADWVDAWSEDYGLRDQIDACLLGAGMYPGYEKYWTGIQKNPERPAWITGTPPTPAEIEWAAFAAKTPHYVLSTSLTSSAWENTRLLGGLDEIADLKQREGKDIYLMGGVKLARSLIDHGLVDEMRLIIYPLIAGAGTTLFETNLSRRPLELKECTQLGDGRVLMAYTFRG